VGKTKDAVHKSDVQDNPPQYTRSKLN